jgi:hypothetical protein
VSINCHSWQGGTGVSRFDLVQALILICADQAHAAHQGEVDAPGLAAACDSKSQAGKDQTRFQRVVISPAGSLFLLVSACPVQIVLPLFSTSINY